jgi:hypothetical protein
MFAGKLVDEISHSNHELSILSLVCDTLRHSRNIVSKDRHAVIERLFDKRGADVQNEKSLIEAICRVGNLKPPSRIWRHDTKSTTTNRPLKLEFESHKERDSFLAIFSKSLRSLSWFENFPGRKPIARRDMTPPELRMLYLLRKECYRRNQEAGRVEFVVVDLQIVTLRQPYPFARRQAADDVTVT